MKCPECGVELDSNAVFCIACGAEIIINETADKSEAADENAEKKKGLFQKKAPKKEATAADKKKKLKLIGIIAIAVIVVIVIIVIAVNIAAAIKANEGRKLLEKIPLGRDIEIIEADTEYDFDDTSDYGAVGHICDFDYICESEGNVVVGGITVPEWAVALEKSGDGTVNKAVLLNFNAIEHNWMGEKTALAIDLSVIEFGTSIKKAERSLGLKPYTIIKESKDNTSVYVYRYHYVDDETENTIVKNFYITVDDAADEVVYVSDSQVDYMKLILGTE
ncbi:MAG: zinc ribbon domain-containing protein [Oscillospiraceae bacterium]|nr:zinc ribbon domain-containing protein [Oscillospiraceae bacterium]